MTHKFFRRFISLALGLAITLTGVTSALAVDGALDPTFGNGGKVTTDFGSIDEGLAVALQSDGKIVVVGKSYNGSNFDFALARYISDGSLDTTFGSNGKVTTDFGNDYDHGFAVALQPDGKIVVAGVVYNAGDFALARYNSDGSLDTTFGSNGKVTTDFGNGSSSDIRTIALQPDGKIIVAGRINSDFAIARYNSDGSLDATFDTNGIVTTSFSSPAAFCYALTLQPDGKIVAAGENQNGTSHEFALARYNGDGSLDATFDTDGRVTTAIGNIWSVGRAIALQSDGKIMVAGSSVIGIGSDFALARYNFDGSLDTTFGTNGMVTTDIGNSDDLSSAVAIQPDGKIVVAGSSFSGGNNDFALARYNSDGSLDTTFDTDGKVTTDLGGNDVGYAIAIQPDTKIVVAGSKDDDFALARYDIAAAAMEVTIDVKPGKLPNRIELEKKVCKDDDNLYVAILTTPDFDAMTMDASTLELGDPNLNGIVNPVRNRARDVDLDGDMDLALAFSLCELVTHEALNTNSTELVLIGMTLNGVSITGRDSVKVVRDD
jgi:uncharacterized delta-60 repeat protein